MTFRMIRKKKNEIGTEAVKELLRSARRGVLALNGDEGYPYAIPINFFYDEEKERILFHGARAGHKVDAIKNCDKVCFTVLGEAEIRDEPWAPYVKSAVLFGRCHPIEDQEKVLETVKRLAMKYFPDEQTADGEIAQYGNAVGMYEILIEHLSGKEVQER